MHRLVIGTLAAVALALPALAQEAGSTYPSGSNLPQRTAGEVGVKTVGQMGGSGGPNAQPKARKGTRKAGAKGTRARTKPPA